MSDVIIHGQYCARCFCVSGPRPAFCVDKMEKIVDNKSVITYDEFISIFTNYEEYLLVPHYKKKPAMQQSILKKFGKNSTCGEVDNITR